MNFSWPNEYLEYADKVKQFALNNLASDIIERDFKGHFSHELWSKCGSFGLLGLAAEPKYGGTHTTIDIMRATLVMQALGYGCSDVGLGIAINAHLWTVQMTISKFGSDEQKEKYLRKMTTGEWIGAHGLSEDDSGSDVFSLKTNAKKVSGGYVLNGHKRLVTLGPICNVGIVIANTNPALGKWGLTAFLVESGMSGFTRLPVQDKMGLRTVPLGRLEFKDCFVPDENILGKVGAGWSISNYSLEFDRCFILSCKLGSMERQLEETIVYAKKRKQFGKSISNFQAVSHRIADMKSRIEISKILLYKMAWMKHNDKSAMLDGAILKLYLSESYVDSSLDAIRVFGGSGYLTENGIERGLRDAVGGIIYAGTSDIQKNIISSHLGL